MSPHLPRLYTVQTFVLSVLQQLPGLLLRKASFTAEERPSSSLRKITFSKKLEKINCMLDHTVRMKTLFPPALGRQALPSDEDLEDKQ